MTKIFSNAKDYKTVTKRISDSQRSVIENKIGFKLLQGQRDQFQYFEMIGDDGRRIGTIIPSSQKGEYGAIEFVFGLDENSSIKGMYIQRSREKDLSFKEKEFLDLFIGRNAKESASLKGLYKGKATIGTSAVINGLIKEITTFAALKDKE